MINHDIFTEFTIIYILLCRPLSFRLFHHITSHHHNARIIHVYGVRTRTQLTLLIERSKWNNNNNKTKKAKKTHTKETRLTQTNFYARKLMEIHISDKREKATNVWSLVLEISVSSCICCVSICEVEFDCVLFEDQRAQFTKFGCHRTKQQREKKNSCETINFEHVPIPYNLFSPTFFQHTAIVSGVLLESVIISIDFVYNNIIVFALKSNCTSILYHE